MLPVPKSLLRKAFTFAVSFGLSKAVAFGAALSLPRLVDAETYGILELALTIGLFAASILGTNVHTVAIRAHLVEEAPNAQAMLTLQTLALSTVGLLAASIAVVMGLGAMSALCAATVSLFAVQFFLSSAARMHGWINLTGWFDNVSIITVAALAAILLVLGMARPQAFLIAFVAIGVAAAIPSARALVGMPPREIRALAMHAVRLGAPMTLYTLSALVMFGTPRIAIAQALTITDVSTYSLCARVATFLVFPHQLLGTGLFRQLYQMKIELVGRLMAAWMVVISLIGLAFAIITRLTSPWLVLGTDVPNTAIVHLMPAVTVQTVLWILNANLEMFVNRELISRTASIALIGLAAAAAGIGFALHAAGMLPLLTVIYLYIGLSLVSLTIQLMLLARKGFAAAPCFAALPLVASPLLVQLLPA
jgi:hypothetical protein